MGQLKQILGLAGLLTLLLAISFRQSPASSAQTGLVLLPGWNNILYLGPTEPVPAALAPIQFAFSGALHWDAPGQRWQSFYPATPQTANLTVLQQGLTYWIAVSSPVSLAQPAIVPPPQQLAPGWNNVAYLGPGAPGSAQIEQSQVWAWDATAQRWRFRDPSAPAASDFQALTPLGVYWLFVSGAAGPSLPASPPSVTATPSSTPTPAGASSCQTFLSLQPQISDAADALTRAGIGALPATGISMPALQSGPDGSGQQPFYIPPTIVEAVAWVETAWHQANWDTSRGASGPTLTSASCAYGLMQILNGMTIAGNPTVSQLAIGSDFHTNIAAGTAMLASDWNRSPDQLPYVGRHDPHILEDWYFALWAYHCFGPVCESYGAHNNPDDPALPWPRPVYNSPDQINSPLGLDYSDYPYQELVYGIIAYPPSANGKQLWAAIPVQLPPHGSVGYPQPNAIGEPSDHLEDGSSLPPYTLSTTTATPTTTPSTGASPTSTPTALAQPSSTPAPPLVPPVTPTPGQ
jgi:hypothetical protein